MGLRNLLIINYLHVFKYTSYLLLWLFLTEVYANDSAENHKDSSELARLWNHNLRSAIDISTRRNEDLKSNNWSSQHVLGLDIHKVFTGSRGDIGTLVFQPYFVRLNNVDMPPFFFDDGDDWELTWRIANFNYTQLANRKLNIRIGHFEVPFGLEQNIDTNGTLRQYTFSHRGIKVDWGMSINGVLPNLEYELSVTRGSGNEYTERDDPYLLSGRVGTSAHNNQVLGFSYLYGDVLGASGTTQRKRIGIDIAHYVNNLEFLFEISGGEDEETEVLNSLGEVSWRNANESVHIFTQLISDGKKMNSSWEDSVTAKLGFQWSLNQHVYLSGAWHKKMDVFSSENKTSKAVFQLRFRI